MKLAEELGRRRDEVSTHQKVRGPGVGVAGTAICGLQGWQAPRAGSSNLHSGGVGCARWDVPSAVSCASSLQACCSHGTWVRVCGQVLKKKPNTGNLQASGGRGLYWVM